MHTLRLVDLAETDAVRCLECEHVYAKPNSGGTLSTNPGCPRCGYVGWATLDAPLRPARPRARSGAGHPPRRLSQRR